ncbi:DUF5071 domain-containing protein [Bacteroides faecium]|nr:DUF5071 domain-containing protein [Bacteroides faecium]
MIYNNSYTVILDDLSEYISTNYESLLKEDMLQLEYKNYIIDVGFYAKEFILYIIKDHNWNIPIRKEQIQENDIISKINKTCIEVLSMNLQELIPENKFDIEAVRRLSENNTGQIASIALPLLEWIADMNWPVASELIHVLPRFHKELLPSIRCILIDQKKDLIWKYWIITRLLIQFPKESQLELLPIIERLAELTPKNEDEIELKEGALNFLENIK